MALFEYRSCTQAGRLMTGTIEAADIEQARVSLDELGLSITELEQAKAPVIPKSVGRNEFLMFNEQLASLTKAGIPLERGLRELAADAGSAKMKSLIGGIANDLEQGMPIDQAVEKRQKHFPPLYGMILKSGIETGRLSEMLANLNRHLQVEQRTKRIVFEALCYPAVILCLAAVLITAVFVLIIPTFAEVLTDMSSGRAGLPFLTQVVLDMAGHVWTFWAVVLVIIGALVFFWMLLSTTAAGRRSKEQFFMHLLLIGRVYKNGLLARLAEAMAVLINAGCTMDAAVELSGQSSSSELLKRDCSILAGQLREGFNIMEAGMGCSVIPRLFLYSIQLGSQRNELKNNLEGLGQMYASKTYSLQSQLQAILLPTMLITIGGVIGLIILSMFLPMVKMVEVMM
ncbi:MAG: type II secretion system F family protein [Phycisphaerae bacterium]|nr:type II secretion system F family protein [Phycisphaerae bacterium]